MIFVALALVQTGIFIELFFMPGTDGRNRFGPDPLASLPTDWRPSHAGVPGFLCSMQRRRANCCGIEFEPEFPTNVARSRAVLAVRRLSHGR